VLFSDKYIGKFLFLYCPFVFETKERKIQGCIPFLTFQRIIFGTQKKRAALKQFFVFNPTIISFTLKVIMPIRLTI